jgi:hypothetical protein
MPDPTPSQVILERALAEVAAYIADDVSADQPICTNYVVVAEWSTLDGEQWITREWDPRRPAWQREGLLHHALHANWGEPT